jgi:antitoxin YefM
LILLQTHALDVTNSSDARKNWSYYYDHVVKTKPLAITKNRDLAFLLSEIHLSTLLEAYRFTYTFDHEVDGSFSGSLDQIDIVANGKTLEELENQFVDSLLEYANDYFVHFFEAKNRKSHLPYVLRVLLQSDREGVRTLISHA